MTFTPTNDHNGPSPQFTLTCISTDGPATTVTWTRDSETVTEGTETVLDDPVTAHYTHTLTGSTAGVHTCTVANDKPSSVSEHLDVQGDLFYVTSIKVNIIVLIKIPPPPSPSTAPSSPHHVTAYQNGLDSVLVSWISSDPTVTGYIIYYQRDNGEQRLSLTVGDTGTNATITGLMAGATYSISVASTSGTLPSTETAAPYDVTIGTKTLLLVISYSIAFCPQSQAPSPSPPFRPLLSWLEPLSLSPALSLCLME